MKIDNIFALLPLAIVVAAPSQSLAATPDTVYALCLGDNNALRPGHEWISDVFAVRYDDLRSKTTSFRKAVAAEDGIEIGANCSFQNSWREAEDYRNDRIAFRRQNKLPYTLFRWP